jgi:hypothetical protein
LVPNTKLEPQWSLQNPENEEPIPRAGMHQTF